MAEEFSDSVQVGTVHDEVAGKGVPEIVKAEIADPSLVERGSEGVLDVREGRRALDGSSSAGEVAGKYVACPPEKPRPPFKAMVYGILE